MDVVFARKAFVNFFDFVYVIRDSGNLQKAVEIASQVRWIAKQHELSNVNSLDY